MKLEVGMYVRLKDNEVGNHIAQIKQLLGLDNMTQLNVFHVFSNYEWERVYEDDVTKASHNIIDLIEEGDLIKIEVYKGSEQSILEVEKNFGFLGVLLPYHEGAVFEQLKEITIKEVLTHEQYEANVCKVGDEGE